MITYYGPTLPTPDFFATFAPLIKNFEEKLVLELFFHFPKPDNDLQSQMSIRNIAIIAHVDHGKT
ncbi:MAG: hypothetical protein ABI763_13795, partial [Bacteroidota bacterium]